MIEASPAFWPFHQQHTAPDPLRRINQDRDIGMAIALIQAKSACCKEEQKQCLTKVQSYVRF
jgi:hypothetical protein